jgi:Permuted papain-like amidase enzyme, YaeF/YiiX, C92 family
MIAPLIIISAGESRNNNHDLSRASAFGKALAIWLCISVTSACTAALPNVEDGDVIFQTSKSSQSVAVQRATHSPYSHMGIVFLRDGQAYVLEASATVGYTRLRDWIARGVGNRYVVKRLRVGLNTQQVERLRATAQVFIGEPYDSTFEWSDSRMYVSIN